MSKFVIPEPKIETIQVQGTDKIFPVRRIYCIGRNYAEHAIEMGGDPDREDPFFFQKNPQCADTSGEFKYPTQSNNVHFEVEMTVALKSGGEDIPVDDALNHVFGYGVGIDMTRRDLQNIAKEQRRPWELSKSFENSAPMSEIVPVSVCGHPDKGLIKLSVNGETKQKGDLGQMVWKVPEMIAYLSRFYDIGAGDLIMSGTPAGVGPIQRGDVMECEVEGVAGISVKVV